MSTLKAQLRAEIAKILGTSERQLQRWIAAKYPVLDARQLRGRLLAQNNYGATGSVLQHQASIDRIQRELDELFGDDIAGSERVFACLGEVIDAIEALSAALKEAKPKRKALLLKQVKGLTAIARSMEDVTFIDPVIHS